MRDNVPRATFASPALGGDTELELDVVEAHAGSCMAGNITLGNAFADTDDHGGGWLAGEWMSEYKCESVAFAIPFDVPANQRGILVRA